MTLKLDRVIVIAALALLTLVGWLYLLLWPMPMPDDAGVATLKYAALTIVMWFLMMIAMMAPAVTSVVLLFDRVARRSSAGIMLTAGFAGGYFSTWLAFSIIVALVQIVLIELSWIDTMGVARPQWLTGSLLIAVGAYQWLPIKGACLDHCRSPVNFLTQHYRPGVAGAWRMGLQHGVYCVGCCWLLMLLLFVGGVMHLGWIAGLTALVVIEKLIPHGAVIGRGVGAALIAAGVMMMAGHV
jgi:predicted metal-binding membrane protein